MKALSIRQPWAWLIVNGWKNIENRTWPTRFRGHVLIHASKGMTRDEYDACINFVAGFAPHLWPQIPCPDDLERGGIIGETVILDCVSHHESEWFCGPYGFVLSESSPLTFRPCKGALGFFEGPLSILIPAGSRAMQVTPGKATLGSSQTERGQTNLVRSGSVARAVSRPSAERHL